MGKFKPGQSGNPKGSRRGHPDPRNSPDGLTDLDRKVVHECLRNGRNKTEAYCTVTGSTAKWARRAAARIFAKPGAKAMIAEADARVRRATERVMKAREINAEWVIDQLIEVSQRCMQVSPVLDRKGNPVLVETREGEIKPAFTFDARGANTALEMLGKHTRAWQENVNLNLRATAAGASDDDLAAIALAGGGATAAPEDDPA